MKQNTENTNAFLIHICGLAGFLYPFGSIITPLIAWQTLKKRSAFLDAQGKEAINFNLSFSMYSFFITLIFLPLTLVTFFKNSFNSNYINWHSLDFDFDFDFDFFNLFSFLGVGSVIGIIVLIRIILTINAAIKSKEGENYKYPLTIKFIK